MATCEKKTAAPIPPPVEYVLTLTECEARMLRQLLGFHVAGEDAAPMLRIDGALRTAGVEPFAHRIVLRGRGDRDTVLLVQPA